MSGNDLDSITEQLGRTTVRAKSELNFAGRGFKLNTEEDAQEIVQAIEKADDLSALRLEGNTLGVVAAKAIGAALSKHAEFERALWSDMFTGRLKSEIPDALRHLGSGVMLAGAHLTELDLSDNAFGPNGMLGLTDLLSSSTCYQLRELRLNNNGLGVTGGKMLAKCLLECHQGGASAGTPLALRVFVSGRGRLENEGSIALAEAFKAMGSLEEVSMPQNGINHVGVTALADAFACNPNLRKINLNDNTFTEVGARSMAKGLAHMQQLECVNFGDCLLRNGGAKVIAAALKDGHRQLKELIMSFNEIRESGASDVAEAMEDKPCLQKLDLDGNQLGEEGVELVRANMEAIGKLALLGSFSDDEGVDSDEDGDEDEETEDDDEDEAEIVQRMTETKVEDSTPDVPTNRCSEAPVTPQKSVTAEDFLLFPSPTKLQQMGAQRAEALARVVKEDINDLDRAMQTFMKLSCVVTSDDEATKKAAFECADAIFTTLFCSAELDSGGTIANMILVHLGLIKSEDKKFRPSTDISGSLLVLEHVVRQTYFTKSARDILQTFISRPSSIFEKCHQSHNLLLQTLQRC